MRPMSVYDPAKPTVPVIVLTGFLGSGKTTLLRRLLADPETRDTAVLVNEFGEIAIDHHLVSEVREDLVVLSSGCICCSVRNDLMRALCDLHVKASRGEIPQYSRVIVETTGLADPTPIVGTVAKNGLLRTCFHLAAVVTAVDAQLGLQTLSRQPESLKQAAIADRILVTKADLATSEEMARLEERLAQINPLAPRTRVAHGDVPRRELIAQAPANPALMGRSARPDGGSTAVTSANDDDRLAAQRDTKDADHAHADDPHADHAHADAPHDEHDRVVPHDDAGPDDVAHGSEDHHEANAEDGEPRAPHAHDAGAADLQTFSETLPGPIDYASFALWLSMMTQVHGEHLLRVKGILHVDDDPMPVVVQSVQHVVYPVTSLPAWPFQPPASKVVVITRGLDRATAGALRDSLRALARGGASATTS